MEEFKGEGTSFVKEWLVQQGLPKIKSMHFKNIIDIKKGLTMYKIMKWESYLSQHNLPL